MKRFLLLFALCLLSIASCEDRFNEINAENQQAPAVVPPNYLLTNIVVETTDMMTVEAWEFGLLLMQQAAKFHSTDNDRYQWGTGASAWNICYRNLRDCKRLYESGEALGNESYQAAALVMQSVLLMHLADLFGDVPYNDAIKGNIGVYQAKYDTQESVYGQVWDGLEKANNLLSPQGASITGDPLYNGNLLQWKQFANSLRVRLLMRLSAKRDVRIPLQNLLQQALMEGPADNASRTFLASAPHQFIVYNRTEGHFTGYRLSEFMGNYLQATADRRLGYLAQPTQASVTDGSPIYHGMPNGLSEGTASTYAGGSNYISLLGTRWREPQTVQANLMRYSELQFLLAEAAERNLIEGNPAEYYQKGIEADFMRYGISPSEDFLSSPALAYEGSTQEKLQKIGMQQWLALNMVGLEAWFKWRRTGFPRISPSAENVNSNRIPVRFRYPEEEQLLNARFYQEAIARQGADDLNTKLWVMP